MRRCAHCSEALSPLARADARYCTTRCRMAAMRLRRTLPTFPLELTDEPRWIRRTHTKVPLRLNGRNASSTDPSTWTTYDRAADSNVGAGLGFVLNGDGIVCLDLDHCFERGALAPWAQRLVDKLPPTFIERSPSGDGLHIWGRANLPFAGRRVQIDGGTVEIYSSARYLTMTGDAWCAQRTLADLTDTLTDIV